MQQKCSICDILLDVPCSNPLCEGHHNESCGELCRYCATNERQDLPFLRNLVSCLVSSLEDCEIDLNDE